MNQQITTYQLTNHELPITNQPITNEKQILTPTSIFKQRACPFFYSDRYK